MFKLQNALIALVGIVPILPFFDTPLADGLIAFYIALVFAIYVFTVRPGEASHLMTVTRWPAVLAVLPALWIIFQLLPIQTGGVSRSIWESAASAMNTTFWAGSSIDPGMTAVALTSYLAAFALAFLTAGIAIDRDAAEKLLLANGIATFVSALALIVCLLTGWIPPLSASAAGPTAPLIAAAAYGAIQSAVVAIMVLERSETRRGKQGVWSSPFVMLGVSTCGFALCCAAVLLADAPHAVVAMCCGIATLAIIYLVRRLGLGLIFAVIVAAVAIFAVVTVIVTKGHPADADIAARYAATGSADLIAGASRIIGEAGFAGTGAGTFDAIYRLYGAPAGQAIPPTFAAQISIELGKPALWIIVAITLALFLAYARGAFSRGRDSFYAAGAAAACVMTVPLAFGDASASSPAIMVLLASTFGLGLAQSISRRA